MAILEGGHIIVPPPHSSCIHQYIHAYINSFFKSIKRHYTRVKTSINHLLHQEKIQYQAEHPELRSTSVEVLVLVLVAESELLKLTLWLCMDSCSSSHCIVARVPRHGLKILPTTLDQHPEAIIFYLHFRFWIINQKKFCVLTFQYFGNENRTIQPYNCFLTLKFITNQ